MKWTPLQQDDPAARVCMVCEQLYAHPNGMPGCRLINDCSSGAAMYHTIKARTCKLGKHAGLPPMQMVTVRGRSVDLTEQRGECRSTKIARIPESRVRGALRRQR